MNNYVKRLQYPLTAFLILVCGNLYSQNGLNSDWQDIFAYSSSNNYSAEGRKVIMDNNGNTFVVSDVTSDIAPNGVTVPGSTFYYIMTRKYDSSGNLLVSKQIDVQGHLVSGFTSQSVFDAALDATGNLYIGFNFFDNISGYDVRYVKYDNALSLQWAYKFNPLSKDLGKAMAVDTAGNAHIVCESESNGTKTYHVLRSNSANQSLGILYSFDAGLDVVNDVKVDESQIVYVTGYRQVGGIKSIMTASVSPTGLLRWKYVYNGGTPNRDDYGTRLTLGNDNHIYVVGSSDRGAGAVSNYDASIHKHRMVNGKVMWIKYEAYTLNDRGLFIENYNQDYIFTASTAGSDIMISRIGKIDGVINSGRIISRPRPDEDYLGSPAVSIIDFKVSPSLKFYVTGTIDAVDLNNQPFSAGYINQFQFTTGARAGFSLIDNYRAEGNNQLSFTSAAMHLNLNYDKLVWVRNSIEDYSLHTREEVHISCLSNGQPLRGAESLTNNEIKLYPNPAKDIVKIETSEEIESAELINLSGQTVAYTRSSLIELNKVSSGMYLIKIISKSGKVSIRKLQVDSGN